MKKWYWALGTIGIGIIILIIALFILPGTNEGAVSNLSIIPAGTFSVFHETNIRTEQNVTGNISECIHETGNTAEPQNQSTTSITKKKAVQEFQSCHLKPQTLKNPIIFFKSC